MKLKNKSENRPKVHKAWIEAIVLALTATMNGMHADKVLQHLFKTNKKYGKNDRAFIADHFYDLLRNLRWVQTILSHNHVDENNPARIVGAYFFLKYGIRDNSFDESFEIPSGIVFTPDQLLSYTKWFYDCLVEDYGEIRAKAIMQEMNHRAKIVLRINTLVCDMQMMRELLEKNGLDYDHCDDVPDALILKEHANVFQWPEFKKGWFEVQDLNSQRVGLIANPVPGDFVVDACAGAGGKTLHLATLMKNKGMIVAMDVERKKLIELKKRAARNQIHNLQIKLIEGKKTIKRLKHKSDLVLLDVPCTGSGVIKRNPDAKWKINKDLLEQMVNLQSEILESYHIMTRPGGKLVYSTCSIFKKENREQVDRFLAKHPEYQLEKDYVFLPDETGYDGFYVAVLKRKV